MPQSFSIKFGKFLYKNAFPIYNRLYPVFKRKQDAQEIALIKSFLKSGFTVLDIGANIGFYTKIFSNLVGEKGHVHAFEPEATNFNYLQQNLQNSKNTTLVNKAVSDKSGILKIYLSKMLNVDHRTYPVDDYESAIEITATTVDDYLSSKNISNIDFIKMDIQGFEMSALTGMKKTLMNNPSIKILTELWPFGLAKAGSSSEEVFNFLTALDLNLFLITENELRLITKETIRELVNHEQQYYNIVVCKQNLSNIAYDTK